MNADNCLYCVFMQNYRDGDAAWHCELDDVPRHYSDQRCNYFVSPTGDVMAVLAAIQGKPIQTGPLAIALAMIGMNAPERRELAQSALASGKSQG